MHVTFYKLDVQGIESQWRRGFPHPTRPSARFSAPYKTVPEAHPFSCMMGTSCFSWGEMRPGSGVDHAPRLAPRLKKE